MLNFYSNSSTIAQYSKRFLSLIISAYVLLCPTLIKGQQRNRFYNDYIEQYHELAILQQQQYGIPASITLAQGLLESSAGRSSLSKVANNHFGIKCHSSWKGKGYYQDDDAENECFRHYDHVEESYRDHSLFLRKKRYIRLFSLSITDYKGWAKGLKQCGYATDPSYSSKLIDIIERYELYSYDTGQKIVAKPLNVAGDETLDHSIEQLIADEMSQTHRIRRKWGLYYIMTKDGDSFETICEELGMPMRKLAKFNDYASTNTPLVGGMILYLQDKKDETPDMDHNEHIVQRGETLHEISQMYAIKLRSLEKINHRNRNEYLSPGTHIYLTEEDY